MPASGRVIVHGEPLSNLAKVERARKIAWLPQRTIIDFDYTVGEVVAMGRAPHIGLFARPSEVDRRAVEEAMAVCSIDGLASRSFNKLSGGEQQRVMISRCLASGATTMLLDEPTTGLDLRYTVAVLDLMRTLRQQGKCVVAIMHDINSVAEHCDRVLALEDGRVAWEGDVQRTLSASRLSDLFGVQVYDASKGEAPSARFGIVPTRDKPTGAGKP
jgi:iron complex transport system ATP-binding protein